MEFKDRWVAFVHDLQDRICSALEDVDGSAKFVEDRWERAEGGGGKTRIISNGAVFEKGGVNTSVVHGKVTDAMSKVLGLPPAGVGGWWFACGLSLVLHPLNPFVPTVHANWRYFEISPPRACTEPVEGVPEPVEGGSLSLSKGWFGGGADLTPYYLFEEDAVHFHRTLKNAIDPFGEGLYPKYKKQCDAYFNNAHRGFEMRGIGGVFYDHLAPPYPPEGGDDRLNLEELFRFQQANGNCFTEAYIPIVEKRKNMPFTPANKYWQEIRRGRYVEFNLIHDRGTIFGLKTNGRTESILMSLPPTVRFDYNYQPAVGSEEEKLLLACKYPKDWVPEISEDDWAARVNRC